MDILALSLSIVSVVVCGVSLLYSIKAASSAREAASSARESTRAFVLTTAYKILQKDSVRTARKSLFSYKKSGRLPDIESDIEADGVFETMEAVWITYDYAAMVIEKDEEARRKIARGYCDSLVKTWDILQEYIEKLRGEGRDRNFCRDYEELVEIARPYKELP